VASYSFNSPCRVHADGAERRYVQRLVTLVCAIVGAVGGSQCRRGHRFVQLDARNAAAPRTM